MTRVKVCLCLVQTGENGQQQYTPLYYFGALFSFYLMTFLQFIDSLTQVSPDLSIEFLVSVNVSGGSFTAIPWKKCLDKLTGGKLKARIMPFADYLYCAVSRLYVGHSRNTCVYCGINLCNDLHVNLILIQLLPNAEAWMCFRHDLYVTHPQKIRRGQIFFCISVKYRAIYYWKKHWVKCRQLFVTHSMSTQFKYILPFLKSRYLKGPASLRALTSKCIAMDTNVKALNKQYPEVKELECLKKLIPFLSKLPSKIF